MVERCEPKCSREAGNQRSNGIKGNRPSVGDRRRGAPQEASLRGSITAVFYPIGLRLRSVEVTFRGRQSILKLQLAGRSYVMSALVGQGGACVEASGKEGVEEHSPECTERKQKAPPQNAAGRDTGNVRHSEGKNHRAEEELKAEEAW